MAADGKADAVCFTPFNKQAMRLAEPTYDDEILFTSNVLGFKGLATEFNVLDNLWNARVTSHIPLAEVSANLSIERIVAGLEITTQALRAAGFQPPRIGVAALNPHAGDGGNFGREEIDIIEPAVKKAKAKGLPADGPYPADTVFVRAKAGQFDAVLTMFHDQGQIAMKLLGFDRGVTLLGGYPFPICTPAHGTAYDIAGKGVANVGAAPRGAAAGGEDGAHPRNGVGTGTALAARRGPRAPLKVKRAAFYNLPKELCNDDTTKYCYCCICCNRSGRRPRRSGAAVRPGECRP